eukprot:2102851-Rhodomonas_salina.2
MCGSLAAAVRSLRFVETAELTLGARLLGDGTRGALLHMLEDASVAEHQPLCRRSAGGGSDGGAVGGNDATVGERREKGRRRKGTGEEEKTPNVRTTREGLARERKDGWSRVGREGNARRERGWTRREKRRKDTA